MAKYLIHTYPKRLWYVEQYLIPSMLAQGITKENIRIYNDEKCEGNLRACMNAFASCEGDGGTWHLQDDVCISKDFKQRTEWYDHGLVCGFSSLMYDGDIEDKKGAVPRERMWFSFPCIRIPNEWARDCAKWVVKCIIGNPVYEAFWKNGTNDDWAFRTWLDQHHHNCVALNIMPCLVDHVDYLLGGGSGKVQRIRPVRAQYWDCPEVIESLEAKLNVKNT